MFVFRDVEDVWEWLEPLDYVALWEALEPYAVFTDEERAHCDQQIRTGLVAQDVILRGLKGMAHTSLRQKFNLPERSYLGLAGDAGGLLH